MSGPARGVAAAVLSLRVAYGVGLTVAPERLALRWLGPAAAGDPTQVALRGLGAREVILHAGALTALAQGRPLRPWLYASAAGDASDIASTVAGRGGLPGGSPVATTIVAGGSALLSLAVAAALDS